MNKKYKHPLKFLLLLVAIAVHPMLMAQNGCPVSPPAAPAIVVLNIKTDFGAKGDGHTNDMRAFEMASQCIQARGGYAKLVIPAGVYRVGRYFSAPDPTAYQTAAISLHNCVQVEIAGEPGSVLKYHDGLKIGSFDLQGNFPSQPLIFTNPSFYLTAAGSTAQIPTALYNKGIRADQFVYEYDLIHSKLKLKGPNYKDANGTNQQDVLEIALAPFIPNYYYNPEAYSFMGKFRYNPSTNPPNDPYAIEYTDGIDGYYPLFWPFDAYKMHTGKMLFFETCSQLNIHHLELDGNSDRYQLGGSYGASLKAYESICYGLYLYEECKDVVIDRLKIHHFGTDNLNIKYSSVATHAHDIAVSNSSFEYSGRNNASVEAFGNTTFTNCTFSFSAKGGRIYTNPGIGISMENDIGGGGGVHFVNCKAMYCSNSALVDEYPTNYDNRYTNCTFHSDEKIIVALTGSPGARYADCKFFGQVVDGSIGSATAAWSEFQNCFISDCYKNQSTIISDKNQALFQAELGSRNRILNGSTIKAYNHASIIVSGPSGNDNHLNEIANNSFTTYLDVLNAPAALGSFCDSRLTNNIFFKRPSTFYNFAPDPATPNANCSTQPNTFIAPNTFNILNGDPKDYLCGTACTTNRTLSDNIHEVDIMYRVSQSITASAEVKCDNAANPGFIKFDAGQKVELLPGFTTEIGAGSVFEAYIVGCAGSPSAARTASPPPVRTEPEIKGSYLNCYPNPGAGLLTIQYQLQPAEKATLQLYNSSGLLIQQMAVPAQGRQTLQLNPGSLTTGTYILRLSSSRETMTRKVVRF